MSPHGSSRLYFIFRADRLGLGIPTVRRDHAFFLGCLDALKALGVPPELADPANFEVHSLPAAGARSLNIAGEPIQAADDEIVISYAFRDGQVLLNFLDNLKKIQGEGRITPSTVLKHFGADAPIALCGDCPAPRLRTIGRRQQARARLSTDHIATRQLTGKGVNVVIVDQGLNREAIEARHPGSLGQPLVTGLSQGAAPPESHGTRMALNVLDIAPEATIYDVPVIPPRIAKPQEFASAADAILRKAIVSIAARRAVEGADQPWILLNAWAVFDRSFEVPRGDYTENLHYGPDGAAEAPGPAVSGHPLVRLMQEAAVGACVDVVFAAGNCGKFTDDPRCGRLDRGARRSIWGANGHPDVLTVAATSVFGDWLGYSSEGPLSWGQGQLKPDIAAPSHFSDDLDPSTVHSGTSTAAALAAGILAAVRTRSAGFTPNRIPPRALKGAVLETATGRARGWNPRTGHGEIDTRALLARVDELSA